MANEDKLDIVLNLITSGANKALDGLKTSFNNTFKGLNTDLGKASGGITGIATNLISVKTAAIAAGTAVLTYLGSKNVINGAIEQESAINSVAIALARTGQYSKATLADLESFASQLQKNSTYAATEIIKQTNLALSYGITSEQAKNVVKASIELAAATGKTLDESMSKVTKTLGGVSGQLGKLNPRIRALTAEQLKNGEAARILLEQYGGTAIGQINNYGGALQQNTNLFHDMLDEVGFLITKNPVVIEGIKALSGVFADLAAYLNSNRDAVISFVNKGLVSILQFAPQIGTTFKVIVSALTIMAKAFTLASAGALTIVNAFIQFGPIKLLLDGLLKAVFAITGGIADLLSLLVKIPGVSDTFEALGISAEDLSAGLGKAAENAYELIGSFNTDSISKGIDQATEFAFQINEGATAVKEDLNKAIDEGVIKAQKLAKTVKGIGARGQVELKVVNNEESSKKSIDNYQQLLETAFGGEKGAKIGGALVAGIASGIKNGKEGARAMLSSLAGAAADAFLPGLGAAVGPIIDVLSQGPEAVREMVKQFAGAIPNLIEAIIKSIPVIIEEFANQMPIIIERLADRADEIIIALIKATPKLIEALALQSPKIMLALIKEAPRFVNALIQAIGDAIKNFLGLNSKKGGILGKGGGGGVGGVLSTGPTKNGLVNTGLNIVTLGGSGIASETVSQLKKVFKFASGGEVPSGFPNDTAQARVSSGELVIDRSTNTDLKKFLSKNDGAGASDVLLARIIQLLEKPMSVSSAVQLNQREFANIMLQINRTQQRTS